MFSFAVILWELMTWEIPWQDVASPWQVWSMEAQGGIRGRAGLCGLWHPLARAAGRSQQGRSWKEKIPLRAAPLTWGGAQANEADAPPLLFCCADCGPACRGRPPAHPAAP